MEKYSTAQMKAVLARLQEAYLTVALCESWLAHYAALSPKHAARHQGAANAANDRALEVARDAN